MRFSLDFGAVIDKYKIPIAIILGAVIIGLLVYFALKTQKLGQVTPMATASPTATTIVVEQSVASGVPSPTPSPQFTEDDAKAIKAALSAKLGTSDDNLDVQITQKDAKHTKGNVKEKTSEVGGGYFLAAKTESGWVIVYDGQATPTCAQIAPYNFPSEMVPECLDSSGKVVAR